MRYKYPKTLHVPGSPGLVRELNDYYKDLNGGRPNYEKVRQQSHMNFDSFKNREVVVTEKMDGENTTMYRDHIHARSIDSKHHVSRDWVKAFHGEIKYMIPEGWRVCGENMYAQHSLIYYGLESYFLGFAIFNENNQMLTWDNTLLWFKILGIEPVPTLWRGNFDDMLKTPMESAIMITEKEGYVIRTADNFIDFDDFQKYTGKWVRPNFIVTDKHWMHREIIPNNLKTS